MGDLTAKCDWHDSTLSIVLPEDPERIAVRLFDSRYAPARLYVPEADALQLHAENAKLRELVRDMWHDGMCECDERGACATCEYGYLDRMRELGVEVDE